MIRALRDDDIPQLARNAPMLAINRRLGYVPFVERLGYVKELNL